MSRDTKSFVESLHHDLRDPQEAAHYLNAAMRDSEEVFLLALRDVVEAHQFSKVAADAGLNRETLYRTLSEKGNPRLGSLWAILKAVGLHMAIDLPRS